jgi:hypothetical protein
VRFVELVAVQLQELARGGRLVRRASKQQRHRGKSKQRLDLCSGS